jgi:hypothetical protein
MKARYPGRLEQGREHLDGRGFAGAVRPEQSENDASRDLRIEVVDRRQAAEFQREPLNINGCVIGRAHIDCGV